MSLVDRSNKYAGVGIGASGVGSLVSLLAFALPYWIYFEKELTLSDATGSYPVQFTYYYGFWKYCNKVLSDFSNTDSCGSVDTHSDVEQTTVSLLLLAILLFVSAVVNGTLYLTALKKEKLCLYIAWVSVVGAGILALTSIVIFARSDHSVTVSNITLTFSASRLHVSFWLVVTGCFMVAIATIFITLAIINARRGEETADEKKSVISYDSVDKKVDIPKEYQYKDPIVPDPYHYGDSPYTTSSESLSDADETFDSDDSEIDPKFAKLKTKLTPKPPGVKSVEPDILEARRCRSGEPTLVVSSGSKVTSAGLFRSRSASELTPVEHPEARPDIVAEKQRVTSGKQQVVSIEPFQENPLYNDDLKNFEPGMAPVATDLVVSLPKPADPDDELVLRRAKTDLPFTQRMRDTIGIASPPSGEEGTLKEHPEFVTAATFPRLPFKRKSPSKKTHKSKHKKPSEEELRRRQLLTDVYAAPPPIKTFYPGQGSHKPAPWNTVKAKVGPRQTSKSLKFVLDAYGADFAKLSHQLKATKKKRRTSATLEDPEQHSEEENSSVA